MTRADALRDLLAAVEAGADTTDFVGRAFYHDPQIIRYFFDTLVGPQVVAVGSAIAFTEVVLPDWEWELSSEGTAAVGDDDSTWYGMCRDSPARALIIAALRALIAQEKPMTDTKTEWTRDLKTDWERRADIEAEERRMKQIKEADAGKKP